MTSDHSQLRKLLEKVRKLLKRIWRAATTFSLTFLLSMNLVFIMALVCSLVAIFGIFGIRWNWIPADFWLNPSSWMIVAYVICIVIAISFVVSTRLLILKPIREMVDKMTQLASGDFSVRISGQRRIEPVEVREFAKAFNTAAEELSGTEILRKDFIHNFSHEFKTPIVSMNGFADLLLEENLPEEDRREYLTIIRDESRRLADLATNILTLSKIESQTILTEQTSFPLDEQIRQAILVTDRKWHNKKLGFSAELPEFQYYGNASLLSEVWINLLDNAAKFSPEEGDISVLLRTEESYVIISIVDHGPGMDLKTQAHIFDQFYQGDPSHAAEGNGLGLAMVQKIITLHHGEIIPDSAPGRGSCFTVRLPL